MAHNYRLSEPWTSLDRVARNGKLHTRLVARASDSTYRSVQFPNGGHAPGLLLESIWNRAVQNCPGSVNNSVSFYFHNANDIVLKPPVNAIKERIGAYFCRPFFEISIFNFMA
jgi:hypothetical protein